MEVTSEGIIAIFEEKVLRCNPMIRIIICEDDLQYQTQIHSRLVQIFNQFNQKVKLHCFSNPTVISNQLLSSCDIAILDIDLNHPKCNGLDIARRIRSFRKDSVIIFLTNFIEYAIKE